MKICNSQDKKLTILFQMDFKDIWSSSYQTANIDNVQIKECLWVHYGKCRIQWMGRWSLCRFRFGHFCFVSLTSAFVILPRVNFKKKILTIVSGNYWSILFLICYFAMQVSEQMGKEWFFYHLLFNNYLLMLHPLCNYSKMVN